MTGNMPPLAIMVARALGYKPQAEIRPMSQEEHANRLLGALGLM